MDARLPTLQLIVAFVETFSEWGLDICVYTTNVQPSQHHDYSNITLRVYLPILMSITQSYYKSLTLQHLVHIVISLALSLVLFMNVHWSYQDIPRLLGSRGGYVPKVVSGLPHSNLLLINRNRVNAIYLLRYTLFLMGIFPLWSALLPGADWACHNELLVATYNTLLQTSNGGSHSPGSTKSQAP